jgi:hypothetical protein
LDSTRKMWWMLLRQVLREVVPSRSCSICRGQGEPTFWSSGTPNACTLFSPRACYLDSFH